jgi:hypothetical protein
MGSMTWGQRLEREGLGVKVLSALGLPASGSNQSTTSMYRQGPSLSLRTGTHVLPVPSEELQAQCNADDQFDNFQRVFRSVMSVSKAEVLKREAKEKHRNQRFAITLVVVCRQKTIRITLHPLRDDAFSSALASASTKRLIPRTCQRASAS